MEVHLSCNAISLLNVNQMLLINFRFQHCVKRLCLIDQQLDSMIVPRSTGEKFHQNDDLSTHRRDTRVANKMSCYPVK